MQIGFWGLFFYSLFCFCAGALTVHFVYRSGIKQEKSELKKLREEQKNLKNKMEEWHGLV